MSEAYFAIFGVAAIITMILLFEAAASIKNRANYSKELRKELAASSIAYLAFAFFFFLSLILLSTSLMGASVPFSDGWAALIPTGTFAALSALYLATTVVRCRAEDYKQAEVAEQATISDSDQKQ